MMDISIELAPNDREALLEMIRLKGIMIGEAIDTADDAEGMTTALEQAGACARLWAVADGGTSLEADEVRMLGELLCENQHEVLADAKREMRSLTRLEAGDPDHVYVGCTIEESIVVGRHEVERGVAAAEGYGRILRQLVEASLRGGVTA